MTAKRNLIILHQPGQQSRSDFETVCANMAVRAPDIAVHILSLGVPVAAGFWEFAAKLPSLIFSAQAVQIPTGQVRGTRLVGIALNSKLEELRVMERAGAPVPETVIIEPDTRFDESHWGPLIVVKPIAGKKGHGISLMRTKDLQWTDTSKLPMDDPRHGQKLLAQRYVDTGPHLASTRVMTVLGRPMYCATSTSVERRADPLKSADREMDVAANGVERIVTLTYDADIIDLARSIHANLPHLPCMGIDIVREHSTGKLYALEYNSRGGFWHISSNFGLKQQRQHGIDYMRQFNALDRMTDAMIAATRNLAV